MIRLLQTLCFAGIAAAAAACADATPTAPSATPAASATSDLVAMSAPAPTASCSYTQLGTTSYQATATWSGFSVTAYDFLDATGSLAQGQLTHPLRSGSVTLTLSAAPTEVDLTGKTIGTKTLCILTT